MILRQPRTVDETPSHENAVVFEKVSVNDSNWGRHTSLQWRLAAVSSLLVLLVVLILSVSTYFLVSKSLYETVDKDLDQATSAMLDRSLDPLFTYNIDTELDRFREYNPSFEAAVSPPGMRFTYGDTIPVGGEFKSAGDGERVSIRTVGDKRVMAKQNQFDGLVVMTYDVRETQRFLQSLGVLLFVIALVGVAAALLAGRMASNTALRPVKRLRHALDYTAVTDELRPIEVKGNDELAQLANSFNLMIGALKDSRQRQAQFVADAGHELKTPLTSMRTNIELMTMLNRSGGEASISDEDRRELEQDVTDQMKELETLISDLVDLSREDAPEKPMGDLDLAEVLESSIERVSRRRKDVTIESSVFSWNMHGDFTALGRATLNLIDNAAKWSPAYGVVRVYMEQEEDNLVSLHVEDSGPGIPETERSRIFDRFYRAPEARSMPGSGLGLAIVKQVIERHEGDIRIAESSDGGCHMIVTLPGTPGESHRVESKADHRAMLERSFEEFKNGKQSNSEDKGGTEDRATSTTWASTFVERYINNT